MIPLNYYACCTKTSSRSYTTPRHWTLRALDLHDLCDSITLAIARVRCKLDILTTLLRPNQPNSHFCLVLEEGTDCDMTCLSAACCHQMHELTWQANRDTNNAALIYSLETAWSKDFPLTQRNVSSSDQDQFQNRLYLRRLLFNTYKGNPSQLERAPWCTVTSQLASQTFSTRKRYSR